MKVLVSLAVLIALSCNGPQQKTGNAKGGSASVNQRTQEMCWAGTIDQKIPIFLHYQRDSNLVIGEVVYLNTKHKHPIKLLGTVEEDGTYRLLAFDKTGNITGIFSGEPGEKSFAGSWVSPKNQKELSFKLASKDTLISSPPIQANPDSVFGVYRYWYGREGYNGLFEFVKVREGKAALYILSLTDKARGPAIAEVKKDTISFEGRGFFYRIPESEDCAFSVKFYKDFVYIHSKSYCSSQFGLNADVDGIYLKTE